MTTTDRMHFHNIVHWNMQPTIKGPLAICAMCIVTCIVCVCVWVSAVRLLVCYSNLLCINSFFSSFDFFFSSPFLICTSSINKILNNNNRHHHHVLCIHAFYSMVWYRLHVWNHTNFERGKLVDFLHFIRYTDIEREKETEREMFAIE